MMNTRNIPLPRLYGIDMQPICRIEPAKVGYDLVQNGLSTATMEIEDGEQYENLPDVCEFVELFDTDGSIGKFRVAADDDKVEAEENHIYHFEHGIATLGDKTIDGYHEYGGTGVNTAAVLTQLLAMQNTVMWVLGECDFSHEYPYSFENDTLLTAIFSIPASFENEYEWTYDMSVFPFVLNLKRVNDDDAFELRRSRNLKSLRIYKDKENLATRLYPKGYGEGTNQLTIASVNGGVPYLDSDTQGTYGIIERQWPDTTFTDAAMLKAVAQRVLDRIKEPAITVTIEAYDLYEATGETLDTFRLGRLGRIPLPRKGITIRERVMGKSKSDVYGKPEDAKLTLKNRAADVTDQMAELVRKATIGELYSQGDTTRYALHNEGNADPTHPHKLKFFLDEGCVHINSVLLNFELEHFRTDVIGAAAGGGSLQTSGSGGGGTHTSLAGGYQNITKPITVNISNNTTGGPKDVFTGYAKPNTDFEAGYPLATGSGGAVTTGASSLSQTGSAGAYTDTGAADGYTDYATMDHYHSIDDHHHFVNAVNTYSSMAQISTNYTVSSNHRHGLAWHVHKIGAHDHSMSHTHTGGTHTHPQTAHAHNYDHYHMLNLVISIPTLEIQVADHYHNTTLPTHDHSVTFQPHTHEPVYGIYEGGIATSVTISVDGNTVPAGAIVNGNVELAAYLAKDEAGLITRNTWHVVLITPDALTRCLEDLFVKTFIRSIGGGVY
jgi:phage minor structural protein